MSDETFHLGMEISGDIYDKFCQRSYWRFSGEDYELGDSVEGEPLILIRKFDGRRFEVSLLAEVEEAKTSD